MNPDAEYIEKLLGEYEQQRIKNKESQDRRINEVYFKLPRVEEIVSEIQHIGLDTIKNIQASPDNAQKVKLDMKERFARLKAERDALLTGAGFPADYMELKYNCSECQDSGYVNNRKCRCFEQKLINRAYANSNLMSILKEQNFDTFSFDYYHNNIIEPEGVSPLARIKDIYNIAYAFAKDFDNYKRSLLFYGSSGLGKTFLSSCITKELLDSGKTVVYTTSARLFSLYDDIKFNRKQDSGIIERAFEADLLIVDDLGTEYMSKTAEPFWFDLLNTRLLNNKKMIISTNHNMNELTKLYTTRFTSRMYEFFTPLKFLGDDIRVQKLSMEYNK